jgi:tetratricopeptide (TPR) repeat protein
MTNLTPAAATTGRNRCRLSLAWISAILLVGLLVLILASSALAATQAQEVAHLSEHVHELAFELNQVQKTTNSVFLPITVLIGILAAGGALGIVFSFRDQRRTSQLHELTVQGEVATQRRAEQSYGSFFEQSQTTLSLVNDTLKLAKEANQEASLTMKSKAQSRVEEIEERAQKLMFDVFHEREFEVIIKNQDRLNELEEVADELQSLEGYLRVQGVKPKEYTRFISAIHKFVGDDTEGALEELELLSQAGIVGELQRFTEYWLGYVLTTIGEYEEAVSRFEHDELNLDHKDPEYFQLERIKAETEFFVRARPKVKSKASTNPEEKRDDDQIPEDIRSPRERFDAVEKILNRLAELKAEIDSSEDERAKVHTQLEVARIRADILEWIAYDPKHLDDPLDVGVIAAVTRRDGSALDIADLKQHTLWQQGDPNVTRAWALTRARQICEETERNFDLEFALAECLFKLSAREEADRAYVNAEHLAATMLGRERHERRTLASLQESILMSHVRLFRFHEREDERATAERREVFHALQKAQEAVGHLRQRRVTVFSQIQRRNISQDEFKKEIRAIVDQGRLGQGSD